MAIIWEKKIKGVAYQVRTAGSSVRLYTNKVFHSQWNPNAVLCGGVWDLLLLPAFMLAKPTQIKNVLVLGVGGGAVIRALSHCLGPNKITGVDLDATHLSIAKRFFGVKTTAIDQSRIKPAHNKAPKIKSFHASTISAQHNNAGPIECRLVHAEAKAWLENNQTKYDLIIEDIFKEDDKGQPIRAVEASAEWMALLRKSLTKKGTLVMNFESQTSWQKAKQTAKKQGLFNSDHSAKYINCAKLALPQYENKMGVFSLCPLDKRLLPTHAKMYANVTQAKWDKMGYSITPYKI